MTRNFDSFTLDPIDEQLLALLREDARRHVTILASAIGVSRATVYNRIRRLEQEGIIAGYTVRTGSDYNKRLVRAHVMIKLWPKLTNATIDALTAISELTALYSISGENDLIAMIEAADLGELDKLIDGIGMLDGVEKTTSSIILSTRALR